MKTKLRQLRVQYKIMCIEQPNWWDSKINKLNEELENSRREIDYVEFEGDIFNHIIEREKVFIVLNNSYITFLSFKY
jgi:hypothetical protein